MQHLDVLLLILVSAVASLLVLSRISRVPYPVLLATGGVLIGFVPGVPRVQLSPEVMLLVFLPPLLFYEASIYQARQFKENLAAISLLAVGLWSGQLSEWRRWRTYWRAWTGALPSFGRGALPDRTHSSHRDRLQGWCAAPCLGGARRGEPHQ